MKKIDKGFILPSAAYTGVPTHIEIVGNNLFCDKTAIYKYPRTYRQRNGIIFELQLRHGLICQVKLSDGFLLLRRKIVGH